MTEQAELFDGSLTLQQLAEIAVERSGGDGRAASAMLQTFAKANPDWIVDNMATLITRRVTDAVSHYLKDRRKALGGTAKDILDWPIWGGKSLGNVSLKEIAESAHSWRRDAATRERKAAFLLKIVDAAQSLKVDPTKEGGARHIPAAELELIFAQIFGDGWVQNELDLAA